MRICFVCLGNICRSPTAEGVMTKLVSEAGLHERIEIDSAGTGAWHVGERADDRALAEARRRGVELESRARQFQSADFASFVLAMDGRNLADLHDLAPDPDARAKVHLLRSFDTAGNGGATSRDGLDVPDPYYGGSNGFADVYDLVDAACRGLLDHLQEHHL